MYSHFSGYPQTALETAIDSFLKPGRNELNFCGYRCDRGPNLLTPQNPCYNQNNSSEESTFFSNALNSGPSFIDQPTQYLTFPRNHPNLDECYLDSNLLSNVNYGNDPQHSFNGEQQYAPVPETRGCRMQQSLFKNDDQCDSDNYSVDHTYRTSTQAAQYELSERTTEVKFSPTSRLDGSDYRAECQNRLAAHFETDERLSSYPSPNPVSSLRLIRKQHQREQDKNRTRSLNFAFGRLRSCLPGFPKDTKLTKIRTLRYAISYIKQLMDTVSQPDPDQADMSGTQSTSNIDYTASHTANKIKHEEPFSKDSGYDSMLEK
ncbi:unnamed protein product [Calicophoron daubneyi]|uniref:BHLH domain-containing protein n=1 Tax=Calicophoron daubneyi TaxID=300641 RepID=A0AAV2TUP7_CALDB